MKVSLILYNYGKHFQRLFWNDIPLKWKDTVHNTESPLKLSLFAFIPSSLPPYLFFPFLLLHTWSCLCLYRFWGWRVSKNRLWRGVVFVPLYVAGCAGQCVNRNVCHMVSLFLQSHPFSSPVLSALLCSSPLSPYLFVCLSHSVFFRERTTVRSCEISMQAVSSHQPSGSQRSWRQSARQPSAQGPMTVTQVDRWGLNSAQWGKEIAQKKRRMALHASRGNEFLGTWWISYWGKRVSCWPCP